MVGSARELHHDLHVAARLTIVNVALPSIERDLSADFSDLQWVIDAYALTVAGFVLAAGSLRLKQLRLPSFDRGDQAIDSERSVENTDALAATAGRARGAASCNTRATRRDTVKTDDGRPRH